LIESELHLGQDAKQKARLCGFSCRTVEWQIKPTPLCNVRLALQCPGIMQTPCPDGTERWGSTSSSLSTSSSTWSRAKLTLSLAFCRTEA